VLDREQEWLRDVLVIVALGATVLAEHTDEVKVIEQGRMNVTIDTLVRIANALGVALVDLFQTPRPEKVVRGRPRTRP
jgi:hypothetical protein